MKISVPNTDTANHLRDDPCDCTPSWNRRDWLARNGLAALATIPAAGILGGRWRMQTTESAKVVHARVYARRHLATMDDREALAKYAVDAAVRAGAQYADARLTQTVQHTYDFEFNGIDDVETVGVGVRVLVNGSWGFAACPSADRAAVEQLARQAVAQATRNAKVGVPRTVDLGKIPVAVGRWSTPIEIDPFTVSVEEKYAFMHAWVEEARRTRLILSSGSSLHFVRQERVVATSEGGQFTQTVYESGGTLFVTHRDYGRVVPQTVPGLLATGRGWELFRDVPTKFQTMHEQFAAEDALLQGIHPPTIGRYAVVCDGATMAAILSATLGAATQLDRALGYEANANGTSFLDDPLAMVGTFKVGAPPLHVTANRSAPAQLATVKWDAEGVTPSDITLVRDGLLHDFQTTREQAAWLAPYYTKVKHPIRSNGCAESEDALGIPLQQMPNLNLEPASANVGIEDLAGSIKDGILFEQGTVMQVDAQLRNGLLFSQRARRIENGRLGPRLSYAVLLFNTLDFWKNLISVGGTSTRTTIPFSQYPRGGEAGALLHLPVKGEPPQLSSHSVQSVAALVGNQPMIDPTRKA